MLPPTRLLSQPGRLLKRWLPATLLLACSAHASFGQEEPPKPYLGIVVEQAAEEGGVMVVDVLKDSPSASAGLKAGDEIQSINGKPVVKTDDMAAALKDQGVGAKLKFVVKREGASVTANVTLIATPSGAPSGGVPVEKNDNPPPTPLPDPDGSPPSTALAPEPARPYLGITVVPHARGGAAISTIRKDSPAARIGFPLGGVIIRVNDTPVDNPDDLINFIASMTPGAQIEISYMHNDRLYRKQVKLSSIGGTAGGAKPEMEVVSPPPAPLPSMPAPREDRPILNGIGRVLGGAPLGGIAPAGQPAQQQIDDLKALVVALEERIARLEAELEAIKKPGAEEVVPAPANDPPAAAPAPPPPAPKP